MQQHIRSVALFALLAFACLALAGTGAVCAQTTRSPLPEPTGFVNDFAGVIDPATKSRMETILTNLRDRAQIEFAVVTVRTTGGQDIFDYSLAVARGWGIGPGNDEKNGLLLLVAIDDRKWFIQVSRHLEGDLPDGLVGEIGRRMRAPFREGRYSQGLMDAVQTFVATLAEKRGFSIEGIDQRYTYRPAEQRQPRGRAQSGLGACGIIIIIIIILVILSSGRGSGSGCLNLLLLNALFNAFSNRSSGWGGGSGGWGGGSGDGGFGGFGGGGDFGGGGAGGDW
jgi:uncharacterized protein